MELDDFKREIEKKFKISELKNYHFSKINKEVNKKD